ncbi:MAG: hypothetical protein HY565_05015 [Candidatus Kerfeldbacteria bacterium]|nr:hypothetical protein [Candidatus Kerfeldbacteria bacterium]
MLNLLPQTRKVAQRRAFVAKQLQFLTGVTVVATSCAVVMLLASDWVLQRWLSDLATTSSTDLISAEEQAELKTIVDEIVLLTTAAQPILTQQPQILPDLVNLLQPTPAGIQLHSLSLDYVEEKLELSGSAATRDDLVDYQQILTAIAGVHKVNLPLSDLTQKDTVPFRINATYEPQNLETIE